MVMRVVNYVVCVSLFYVIDTGSIGSRAGRVAELGVTYLPFTILSSDAGYADLPLALLGAPVDIGALIKTWVTVSWQGQDRDWQAALPGQDHMDPFGFIGVTPMDPFGYIGVTPTVAPRYIPAGAVSEVLLRMCCQLVNYVV